MIGLNERKRILKELFELYPDYQWVITPDKKTRARMIREMNLFMMDDALIGKYTINGRVYRSGIASIELNKDYFWHAQRIMNSLNDMLKEKTIPDTGDGGCH